MDKKHTIYAEELEPGVLEQFYGALEQDFAARGALMPDAHLGYSLPIGGVVATENVILPSWVGYDIGCGMCAMPLALSINELNEEDLQAWHDKIYETIPVGFSKRNKRQTRAVMPEELDVRDLSQIGKDAFTKRGGWSNLGTLGGGNHFIEIAKNKEGVVWIVIHSGSRGVGHGIAESYMKLASESDKPKEGHFGFEEGSDLGESYINDLNWCLEFALENRKQMLIGTIVALTISKPDLVMPINPDTFGHMINRNHNHAEKKDGLWIHRKGATHAEKGMFGVIPGNMRDGSFIVKGLGNPESLFSSSHGAGRVMSRRKAKENISEEEYKKDMEEVIHKGLHLDEAPAAYKNIFEVMELQKDLVEVVEYLTPIINVKG